jgi:hypothetical protein
VRPVAKPIGGNCWARKSTRRMAAIIATNPGLACPD